jgi:putative FmdB family regulatory protein
MRGPGAHEGARTKRAASCELDRGLRVYGVQADSTASVLHLVPTYEYRCPNGHVFELFKRIADPQPDKCPVCGASPVETVLYPVPVHFRGSGFYSTDYGRGGRKKEPAKESSESSSNDKGDKGGDKGDSSEKKSSSTEQKAAEG